MGVPPINNHYILLLIYLKSAYSGALVHTVSPYVIPCYYMLIYVLCQVFFDEIAIFVNVKCYCITFSKKFELTENTYDVNVFMLVCILLYVGTLNFIVRQLNL